MKVYLVGPTGVGKSTLGRLLAERLGLPFLDTDELVAARAGRGLAAVFAREGEAGFRRREREAVELAARLGECVAALGGGAVLDPEVRDLLTRTGTVVCLSADPGLLVERLRACPRAGLPHPGEPHFVERARAAFLRRVEAAAGLGPCLDVTGLDPARAVAGVMALLGHTGNRGGGGAPDRVGSMAGEGGCGRGGGDPGWSLEVTAGGLTCQVRGWRGRVRNGTLPAPSSDGGVSSLLVVSAPVPYSLFGRALAEAWRRQGVPVHVALVPDGEECKGVRWLERLWSAWARVRADRGSLVVAVGGGTVSDLGGFAAATYLRGLPWAVVPTTLLSQVDAALGGKVAVDLPRGKNLVGAFWQPLRVDVDVEVLASLPRAQMASGLAEVVKCALLEGEDFLSLLESGAEALCERDPALTEEAVRRCLALKARLVECDERDGGPRQLLNLGHTVGHALEHEAGWDHGAAVAVGLVAACHLAGADGLARRTRALLQRLGLPVHIPAGMAARVRRRMAWDKKARGGELRFVLPQAPGVVRWGVPVEEAVVRQVLRAMEE